MKKLAKWLSEHFVLWPWDEKQGPLFLWFMFVIIGLTVVWHFLKWDWAIYWQSLAGIVTFGLPLLAAVIALIKKQKWNPWFWFPGAIGMVIGGLISIIIGLICGWGTLA